MKKKKIFRVIVFISLAVYIVALLYLLFLRSRLAFGYGIYATSFAERLQYATNFVPSRTIGDYIARLFEGNINISIVMENLLGNFLLLSPLGFYLLFISKKLSRLSIYATRVALIILAVEVTQFITQTGSLDVDDFILNFSGAIMGWLVFTKTPLKGLLNH